MMNETLIRHGYHITLLWIMDVIAGNRQPMRRTTPVQDKLDETTGHH